MPVVDARPEVATVAVAEPAAPSSAADPSAFPWAWRAAGAVLVTNAIFIVVQRLSLYLSSDGHGVMPFRRGDLGSLPVIIDLCVGAYLLGCRESARPWAIARCAIGGLVVGGLALVKADILTLVLQALFCGGLLALLVGRPGLKRTAVALVGVGLFLLLETGGLAR